MVWWTDNPSQIPYYNANTQQTIIPQSTQQGISQAQQQISWATTAPISDDFYSPDNFMYTGMSKQQYDLLDESWKIQALQSWETFLKQRQWIQWQAEKFQEYTRQKEYLNQQNALKGQMTNIQEQNNKIQSEQQLRSSQQALNNLEQNLWFIWSGWKPAAFKQAMEAMKFQMFDAQRLHSELITMQENGQKLRDLGIEFDENQFNKQMQDMEYQMNDQVDKVVQQALQGFNSQMMLWQVDSPAKLNELTNKWLDSIDMDVTNVTNRQMWMITNMISQYKTLADEAKTRLAEDAKQKSEYQKWTNTVNEAMSKVKGYYVDGNGQAIVSTDGKPVQIPEKAPMEPVFKDWYLITFSTDANGQIVANPQKVMEASDMDKINLALKWEELKAKQLENAAAQWVDITWLWGATWDLRYLADQFPNQAWAKNNNPAGITWNGNFDNPKPWTTAYALQQAWVNFQKWTARPASEGWNYVTFPTIEDWLKAQQIMMTQTYWNKTVDQMLRSWVGTWEWPRYAQQVAWMAWVPLNVKVSQLTPEQLSTLQSAKIQKESPWLAKLLKQPAKQTQQFDPNKTAQYTSYVESWKMPVWMKSWTPMADQFIREANQWYIQAKEKVANQAWFTISNPDAFIGVDDKVRDTVNKWLSSLPAFRDTMDKLIKEVEKSGTEIMPWETKTKMQQLVTNAKLQAKEIYNLWVLNWPDLDLMSTIIPDPTAPWAKFNQLFWAWISYKEALKSAKDTVLWVWQSNASQVGLTPTQQEQSWTVSKDFQSKWRIK